MCTSFAVYGQKKTVYGMTFDTDEIDLKLKVNSYNDMSYFFFAGFAGDGFADIAGFNSEGLFVCTQAVEYGPEFKAGCDENDWYAFSIFGDVIKKTGKASEFNEISGGRVIAYPRNPLYPHLGLHTLVADKNGDAFIIEEGNGKNVVCPIQDKLIVMTNFPNGNFVGSDYDKVSGMGADRYIRAYAYIQEHIHDFDVKEAFDILGKTSQANTLCSIVYDPSENEIYINFKKDFSKKWKISITEKTIQSMDGFLSSNKIQLTNGEILVNDLLSLYK